MPMGRPPVPAEVKQRRGTARPDRLPVPVGGTAVVPALTELPRAPRGLSTGARKLWTDIWTAAKTWVIQGLDQALVEQTCRLYDEIALYRRELAKRGPLLEEPISSPSGKVVGERLVANPVVKLLRDAEKQWTANLVLLALPPTERARLGLTLVKSESKMEKLLAARQKRSDRLGDDGREDMPATDSHPGSRS